ncbi:Urokinase plasminogen activator surface receptor [Channa argus]|uniref:Urokinase plasminogen activator surface receptor n=1 Tax=Channa argus TaxID=215402 RepID=A0A6G1PNI3_CHAAH|nr:Urokinase plasminogen activator surface receptor [Channa argus]
MHLLTLIFGIVLLPKAHTLKCYECLPGFTSGSCTNKEKECPSQTQCLASRVVSYAGESKLVDMSLKTCSLAEDCIGGSINYGAYRTAVTTKCCTTELCNNQPPADPNRSKPNGKKCFTCNNQTCTAALDCEGDEDYCISATVAAVGQEMTVKGCVSKSVCSNEVSAWLKGSMQAQMSCCQGDFCNSASSIRAGLLLLLAPLISLAVLF